MITKYGITHRIQPRVHSIFRCPSNYFYNSKLLATTKNGLQIRNQYRKNTNVTDIFFIINKFKHYQNIFTITKYVPPKEKGS